MLNLVFRCVIENFKVFYVGILQMHLKREENTFVVIPYDFDNTLQVCDQHVSGLHTIIALHTCNAKLD